MPFASFAIMFNSFNNFLNYIEIKDEVIGWIKP